MLRSNSKSLGNHVVSPAEEKERLQSEGFAFACPTAACRISNYSFPVIHIYSRSTDRIAVLCNATITFNKESCRLAHNNAYVIVYRRCCASEKI